MSFNIALTGLSAVNEQLNTIGNNIANAGTVGFKSSRANFGSLYAESQAMGVEVTGTSQSISQGGALTTTNRSMDLAISGGGFFVTRASNGDVSYTRAGVFGTDKDSYLTNSLGQRLQGYPADATGNLQTGTVSDLQLKAGGLPAKATDELSFVANLDANQEVPAVAFDPLVADSYNSTYTTKLYDSQGKEHTLTQYFAKTADNSWNAHYYVDGAAIAGPQALTFDGAGTLAAPIGKVPLNAALTGGVDPLAIQLDYSGTSQYGSEFSVTSNRATGYSAGEQTGMSVEKDGKVYASYSNGERLLQGQVDGLGNTGETLGYPDLPKMTARVKIKPVKPKLHAPVHFVDKGLARLFQPFRFRMTKIDQVTVVGKNLLRLVAVNFTALLEQLNAFL